MTGRANRSTGLLGALPLLIDPLVAAAYLSAQGFVMFTSADAPRCPARELRVPWTWATSHVQDIVTATGVTSARLRRPCQYGAT